MEGSNQRIQNVEASIKSLEQQFGQIAAQISDREKGIFPSQTVPNPRGHEDCNVVWTLRCGKSYDNHANCTEQNLPAMPITAESEMPAAEPDKSAEKQNLHSTKIIPKQISQRVYDPPLPYPERVIPKARDRQLKDFMQTLSKVQINIPLLDAIEKIPSYAKFLKEVCSSKKKVAYLDKVVLTEQCNVVFLHKLPPKKKDPGSFNISCTIGNSDFKSALIDLGASINLMPFSVFQRLGQGDLKPTSIILQLADRSITYPRGVIEDLIIKVDNPYLPADFVVLDMDEDLHTPLILGRPFMATARTLIDVEAGTLTLRVQDQSVVFNLFEAAKHLVEQQDCMRIDVLDNMVQDSFYASSNTDQMLHVLQGEIGTDSEDDGVLEYIHALDRAAETLPVIVAADLTPTEEDKLLRVLRKYQDALGWTIADIKGISPAICMHRILMEDDVKPTGDAQRRLNPIMKEVVRTEVMKLLDAEKELLAVVFALEKFRSYLVGAKIIVYTDHAALKYLLSKKDAKPRLIRWVLLLQEFDLEIKDKKGCENVVADHFSRLIIPATKEADLLPLSESFPNEQLFAAQINTPWFADIVNYLATGVVHPDFSF
ncbi:unnamed protein product [Malus baccata var. baccata]